MPGTTADNFGMRRIGWVRVVVDGGDVRAEVSGIGHRLPRTVPVSVTTASSLVADGVPLVMHRKADHRHQAPAEAV